MQHQQAVQNGRRSRKWHCWRTCQRLQILSLQVYPERQRQFSYLLIINTLHVLRYKGPSPGFAYFVYVWKDVFHVNIRKLFASQVHLLRQCPVSHLTQGNQNIHLSFRKIYNDVILLILSCPIKILKYCVVESLIGQLQVFHSFSHLGIFDRITNLHFFQQISPLSDVAQHSIPTIQ